MSVTRTVVPGDWYGVLGASVIVLLPPAAKSRVAGLWETVDDGAGFDEVLDALISNGQLGHRLFDYPCVSVQQLAQWIAQWVMSGGQSLGKPTHFEARDGKY